MLGEKEQRPPQGIFAEKIDGQLTVFTPRGLLKILQTLIILIRIVP